MNSGEDKVFYGWYVVAVAFLTNFMSTGHGVLYLQRPDDPPLRPEGVDPHGTERRAGDRTGRGHLELAPVRHPRDTRGASHPDVPGIDRVRFRLRESRPGEQDRPFLSSLYAPLHGKRRHERDRVQYGRLQLVCGEEGQGLWAWPPRAFPFPEPSSPSWPCGFWTETDLRSVFLYTGLMAWTLAPVIWLVVRDWPEEWGMVPDGSALEPRGPWRRAIRR